MGTMNFLATQKHIEGSMKKGMASILMSDSDDSPDIIPHFYFRLVCFRVMPHIQHNDEQEMLIAYLATRGPKSEFSKFLISSRVFAQDLSFIEEIPDMSDGTTSSTPFCPPRSTSRRD
jgi:hypothetical protein